MSTDNSKAAPLISKKHDDLGIHVRAESIGTGLLVLVAGEADMATAQPLREQLARVLASTYGALIVDVSALRFCDLTGLDALRLGLSMADTLGRDVTWCGVSRQLSWLAHTFPVAVTPVAGNVESLPGQSSGTLGHDDGDTVQTLATDGEH